MVPLRPPYSPTDLSLGVVALVSAILDVVEMFVPVGVDRQTRNTLLGVLTQVLTVALSALVVNRAAKHVSAGLASRNSGRG